jgi:GNAT superfamily N-acetyltransferase
MTLTIKRVDATQENTAALLHWLQVETLPGDTPLEVSGGYWWIAYLDGNPAAFCSLNRSSRWSNTGYLSRAGVLRKHRGIGLQKKLIRVRIALAKRLGWTYVFSDTYENPASTNNLIACGFRMYLPNKPYAGEGTIYWRKKL